MPSVHGPRPLEPHDLLEIRRVASGQPLLVEPPAEDLRAVDEELDGNTCRLIRRKGMDELITDSVGLVPAPFPSR